MEFVEMELTEEQRESDISCDSPLTCQLCEIEELCRVDNAPECGRDTYFIKKKEENMNKPLVLLNEQHSLLPDQLRLLDARFPNGWTIMSIPTEGWTLKEQRNIVKDWPNCTAIFASHVPYLLSALAQKAGNWDDNSCNYCLVFHNDNRDKKELPNGETISVNARTGWQLV